MHAVAEDGSKRVMHHFVSTGGSYGSNPLEGHVGIGKAIAIEKIIVWWQATGKKQELADVPINSKIVITEGKVGFEVITPLTFVVDASQLATHEPEHTCH